MEKGLYAAPMGLSDLEIQPDIEIDIELEPIDGEMEDVAETKDTAEDFGANDQSALGRTGLNHGISHGHGIDKAAANRLNIKHGAACNAQFVLKQSRRGREHHVWRGSGNDDQIDV